jgi:hypothetical protein
MQGRHNMRRAAAAGGKAEQLGAKAALVQQKASVLDRAGWAKAPASHATSAAYRWPSCMQLLSLLLRLLQ